MFLYPKVPPKERATENTYTSQQYINTFPSISAYFIQHLVVSIKTQFSE